VLRATSIVLVVMLTGCAGPSVAPVDANHPAHPDAPPGAPAPRSNTLALQSDEPAAADAPAPATTAGSVTYACPMHPKVTSPAPGKCPICGMALKPVAARTPTQPAADRAADDHGAHQHGTPEHGAPDRGAHDHGGHE
jgi:hypothetical protein